MAGDGSEREAARIRGEVSDSPWWRRAGNLFNRFYAMDSDGDGLSNSEERRLGTDPLRDDTDGDGVDDYDEVKAGTNPTHQDEGRAGEQETEPTSAHVAIPGQVGFTVFYDADGNVTRLETDDGETVLADEAASRYWDTYTEFAAEQGLSVPHLGPKDGEPDNTPVGSRDTTPSTGSEPDDGVADGQGGARPTIPVQVPKGEAGYTPKGYENADQYEWLRGYGEAALYVGPDGEVVGRDGIPEGSIIRAEDFIVGRQRGVDHLLKGKAGEEVPNQGSPASSEREPDPIGGSDQSEGEPDPSERTPSPTDPRRDMLDPTPETSAADPRAWNPQGGRTPGGAPGGSAGTTGSDSGGAAGAGSGTGGSSTTLRPDRSAYDPTATSADPFPVGGSASGTPSADPDTAGTAGAAGGNAAGGNAGGGSGAGSNTAGAASSATVTANDGDVRDGWKIDYDDGTSARYSQDKDGNWYDQDGNQIPESEVDQDVVAAADAADAADADDDTTADDGTQPSTGSSEDPTGDTYQPTEEDLERSMEGRDWIRDGQPIDYADEGYTEGRGDPVWGRQPGVDNPGPLDNGSRREDIIVDDVAATDTGNIDPSPMDNSAPQANGPYIDEFQDAGGPGQLPLDPPTGTGEPQDEEPGTMVEAEINIDPPEPALNEETNPLGLQQFFAGNLGPEQAAAASEAESRPTAREAIASPDSSDPTPEASNPQPPSRITLDTDPALTIDRTTSVDEATESTTDIDPVVQEAQTVRGDITPDSSETIDTPLARGSSSPASRYVQQDQDLGLRLDGSRMDDSGPVADTVDDLVMGVVESETEPEPLAAVEPDPVDPRESAFGDNDPFEEPGDEWAIREPEPTADGGTLRYEVSREAVDLEDLDPLP